MVSVIIVNHNYGKYISKAMDSVLCQTVQDFELIIIDGDSSDNSREIIYEYVKRYPQRITAVFKPTSGQAAALNIGYLLSKGEILTFLDSDDYWFDTKLETIIEQHKTKNAIAHAFSMNETAVEYDDSEIRFMNESSKYLRSYGICMTFGAITSALSIKRELCEKIFPIPEEEYITYADSYIITSSVYYDQVTFLSDVLTYQRIHIDNASISATQKDPYFFTKLFSKNTKLINDRLRNKNLPLIPVLTPDRYKDFLREIEFPVNAGENYIIWGAGSAGIQIKKVMDEYGVGIRFFCDSSDRKIGTRIDNVLIISPDELRIRRKEVDKILVVSQLYSHQICKSLQELGFVEGKDYIDLRLKYYPIPFSDRESNDKGR